MEHKKIELPKFMNIFLVEYLAYRPDMSMTQKGVVIRGTLHEISMGSLSYSYTQEVDEWLAIDLNLAVFIQAILLGYESEPEPRWGIKNVDSLGFGEVIDLNKERNENDN